MRQITKTRTGNIISDTDLELEYLYVGDYGKENNIKASFLGYDKRIDKVDCLEAKTLCARDYKGFGTGFDTMNGVIECQK